ncbi:two-component system response regulator [Marivita sp. S0852]|uniref:response regulator n=1 Tax=Marivita sp. S0852 TaxID=3373893 RepID=UPI0039820A95
MKILAVDDEPHILELLTMMAARAGFTDVSTALSGEIALGMLNTGDAVFDCLLLDISMPGMDGIELCNLARRLPGYSKTPIIMLTAMTDKDYIDSAFSVGATDYANKPFDIVELHSRLQMAEELVAGRQTAISGKTKTNGSHSDDIHSQDLDLSEEIEIEAIKNFIKYNALGNYLTQLSSSGIAGSQVLAIKIDQIEAIFARASSEEFIYVLTEAAEAISVVFSNEGYMMAYAGNGTFMVVSTKAPLETSVGLEIEIQNLLDQRNIEYDSGDSVDIDISIGDPLRASTSKTQCIRKTFDRAIARAEK